MRCVAPAAGTSASVRCRAALCGASAGAAPAPAPAAGVAPAQPADSCCATACLRPLCPAAAPALAWDPLPAEFPLDGPLNGTAGPACCRLSAAASTFCTSGRDGSKGTGPSDVSPSSGMASWVHSICCPAGETGSDSRLGGMAANMV